MKSKKLGYKAKEVDKLKKEKNNPQKIKKKFKKILTKQNIWNFLVFIIDIILIIYVARKNNINYVTINSNDPIYLGDWHNLFWGRNYITIVITLVVYIYFFLLNKFYFKKEIKTKYFVIAFLSILLLNSLLFYLFTNKVY